VPIARLLRFLDQAGMRLMRKELFQEAYVPQRGRLRGPRLATHARGNQQLRASWRVRVRWAN
jgi:hypothetical protein